MMAEYRRNHYVPEWYQRRFLPPGLKEQKFFYLDLHPETLVQNGHGYTRRSLLRWGPSKCFYEEDLYTTRFGNWESTEIEEKFFGKVDADGSKAVAHWADFTPKSGFDCLNELVQYMSVQRLRTPKGLAHFTNLLQSSNKNAVLVALQELKQLFCATWVECVWCIVDASRSDTKFLISDHPVTVYNGACFPLSKWCRGCADPDIRLSATHTLFPLSLDKMLVLTNLSWARNPYGDPLKLRPNPGLFRDTIFNFTQIQIGRKLSEEEVCEINHIVKTRACRYVAAARKEWLYPERHISIRRWDKLGNGYLLMPDPRSMSFPSDVYIGYESGRSEAFDEYGRRPWDADYSDKAHRNQEWITLQAFKGEFARVFGPKRRGSSFELGSLAEEDSPSYHKSLLRSEGYYKSRLPRSRVKKRRNQKKRKRRK